MITLFIIMLLAILFALFWVGLKLTGVVLKALLWLVVALPLGLIAGTVGLALCCTIILIPVGLALMELALSILIPVRI